tara:strand:+ start:1559 stop:2893 length:1335 start_codon:yes stop_codon:yes gene_type:complete
MTNYIGNKPTDVPLTASDIPDLPTSKITSGTFAESFLVNATTDLQPIKSDITALALREATNESSASFNLPNQHIETFATDTLGTKTNAIVTSGYVYAGATTYGSPTTTADDIVVLDSYGHSDEEDNFVDLSTSGVGQTAISHTGTVKYDNGASLTGVNVSIYSDGGSGDIMYNTANSPSTTAIQNLPSETNYTVELWVYPLGSENYGSNGDSLLDIGQILQWEFDGSENLYIYNAGNSSSHANLGTLTDDAWNHVAYVKQGSTYYAYKNGTQMATGTAYSSNFTDNYFRMMYHRSSTARHFKGFVDLFRIRKTAIYPDGTSFTPANVWNYDSVSINATGTAIQNTNTVGSAKTEVGGTILYKDNQGTATLGTDLKVYFSCDGGSNWTEASSYNAITPVYSTGIKQVRLGKTTCTSGTNVLYKVEWANQVASSKETQLHGIGINY